MNKWFCPVSHVDSINVIYPVAQGTLGMSVAEYLAHPRFKCALALALFNEVGLLAVLPDAARGETGVRARALSDWLSGTDAFDGSITERERRFLMFCAGHDFRMPPPVQQVRL